MGQQPIINRKSDAFDKIVNNLRTDSVDFEHI